MYHGQLIRIYKKELENIVMSYESYIQAIYKQLEKRKQQQLEQASEDDDPQPQQV